MRDDEVMPHKSKKNTRRWCKGKVGREHTPEIRHTGERNGWAKGWVCGPRRWGLKGWSCHHEEICTTCGKLLRWTLGGDCPDLDRSRVRAIRPTAD